MTFTRPTREPGALRYACLNRKNPALFTQVARIHNRCSYVLGRIEEHEPASRHGAVHGEVSVAMKKYPLVAKSRYPVLAR
jgi:hypothetical protein